MRYLTADCGATNSSWAVYSTMGKKLDFGNLQGINFFEEKEDGITRLIQQISELNLRNIDYASFSIAGTGNDICHSRAIDQIRKLRHLLPIKKGIYLYNDGEAALWSSFKGKSGISIISGTGAIAYGKDSEGNSYRCGGWGIWAGDEGSAYWIAHEAVIAVFHAYDGRYSSTLLTDIILKKYNLLTVPELISLLSNIEKREIASIAIEVDNAAKKGDLLAINILDAAGKHLSEQVVAVIKSINYSSELRISCHGSVLQKNKIVKKSFFKHLKLKYKDIKIVENKNRNEKGAYLLMLDSIGRQIPPDIN